MANGQSDRAYVFTNDIHDLLNDDYGGLCATLDRNRFSGCRRARLRVAVIGHSEYHQTDSHAPDTLWRAEGAKYHDYLYRGSYVNPDQFTKSKSY